MGFIISLVGLTCLHFHFLNITIGHLQLFPLPISLSIMILGFLYSYKELRKEKYLCFALLSLFMIVLTIMDNVRIEYLSVQTLLCTLFMGMSLQEITFSKHKIVAYIMIVIYTIAGCLKIGENIYSSLRLTLSHYHVPIQLMLLLSFLFLVIYVFLHREYFGSQVHIHQKSQFQSPLLYHTMIALSVIGIIVSTPTLGRYINQQAQQITILSLENEIISIKYLVYMTNHYLSGDQHFQTTSPLVTLKQDIHPQTLKISDGGLLDDSFLGHFMYHKNKTYQFIVDHNFSIEDIQTMLNKHSYVLYLDETKYPITAQKENYQTYCLDTKDIHISQAVILDQQVLQMPRVEYKVCQNKSIQTMTIQDIHNQILASTSSFQYFIRDGRMIYQPTLIKATHLSDGPYKLVITYDHQQSEEYYLYEDH